MRAAIKRSTCGWDEGWAYAIETADVLAHFPSVDDDQEAA